MAEGIEYLILGRGYIGTYLSQHLEDSILCPDRISMAHEAHSIISKYKPRCVINCIGKTGHPNVDWCEDHKKETFFSNVTVPIYLAKVCKKKDVHLINIGTGCIFESDIPLDDYAKPNFFGSFYSRTKAMIEEILLEESRATTIRIRMPASEVNSPKNILTKISKYHNVTEIPNSITLIDDLVMGIPFIVKNNMYGTVNLTHPQNTSIANLKSIMQQEYDIVGQEDLGIGERSNTLLSPRRLLDKGFKFSPFEETVKKYSEDLK